MPDGYNWPFTQQEHDQAAERGGIALLVAAITLIVAAIAALIL